MLPGKRRFKDFLENPVTKYMEDIVKGYTKITAALAAFVLLFIAIGVSTPDTASAQAATITIVPTSPSTLTTDAKKNNTTCSVITGLSTCAAGDNTYTITVTDAAANTAAAEFNTVEVTIKNADLATVTGKWAPDANAKTITLLETAIDTGIFTRLVTTKHASTGLIFNGGNGRVSASTSTTSSTVLSWDNVAGNDAISGNDLALTVAEQTAIVAANLTTVYDGSAGVANNMNLALAISAVSTAGVVTHAAVGTALIAGDYLYTPALVETKAFSGNTLTGTYKPSGTLGISKSITVDNVKSSLVSNSPAVDLITKSAKTVTFNADITDTGAGYPSKSSNIVANNTAGTKGRIQLFVGSKAAGAVTVPSSSYSAITNGWNLSYSVSSTDIKNIGPRVPFWIEAEDLAGNVQKPSAGYKGNTTSQGLTTTVVDTSLIGMGDDMLNNQSVMIYYAGVKETKVISDFVSATGVMTTAAFSAVTPANVEYELKGVGLVTVDSVAPTVASAAAVQTGHNWSASKAAGSRIRTGLFDKDTSIRVTFTDASGLLASTVSPASFSVAGNTVVSTLLVDVVGENAAAPVQRIPNDVFLTLGTALSSSGRPNVSVIGGIITDKAGNAVVSGTYKATDKLGVGLATSKNVEFSKKEVKITITADEQLLAAPTVLQKDLNSATSSTSFGGTITTGTSTTQKGALTYEYKSTIAGIPGSQAGAEMNVYITGNDTSSNIGKAGHNTDGANPAAIIFELDKKLNGGANPKVSVSDKVAEVTSGSITTATVSTTNVGPSIESVDPLIVTVDFNRRCVTAVCTLTAASDALGESKEYARDSYKTVTLTKATMKVTFSDGTYETTTFDVATDITSPDNKRFTIPVSSPKVGQYELSIQAVDQAGNNNLDASTAAAAQTLKWDWKITAAKPVKLALSPGWNLISLPFQPANPAINSVIASTHPADIVMTFDNANQVWLVSRRDADSGLFAGDVTVMTANTAYFVRTNNFQELSVLRPPTATAAAAPPPPPAIAVVPGWNLVPVVSLSLPLPVGIAADSYFGTLQSGANKGWLKAMTFSPLTRTWSSVTPSTTTTYVVGAINPCTNAALVAADVATQSEPCQSGAYTIVTADGGFDGSDTVALKPPVLVGKGYWLYATAAGVVIP